MANRDRFVLPEDCEISLFTNIIKEACTWFNDADKDNVIEKE